MNATRESLQALTAGDVMNRDVLVIPGQMTARELIPIFHRSGAGAAAVVNEEGRCVGMLGSVDIFRWVEAGCPLTASGLTVTCPYRVSGRLLNGYMGVMCTRWDGGCPFQMVQPTTGGRHTLVCTKPETEQPATGGEPCYLTTHGVTVKPRAPLLELVRDFIATRADHLIVVDELDRPIGIVAAADVVNAIGKD